MKLKVIAEESRNERSTMSKLENAIYEACNMAFMLAAAVEDCNDPEEKPEAITFGVYKLHDMVRETKEIYGKLHEEIHQVNIERETPRSRRTWPTRLRVARPFPTAACGYPTRRSRN
jgi:hypothetical protein